MDRLQLFWDTITQNFWNNFFFVCLGILSERWMRRWRLRDKNPYKWACVDCRENGSQFYASCDNVEGLDIIILHHKRASHSGS